MGCLLLYWGSYDICSAFGQVCYVGGLSSRIPAYVSTASSTSAAWPRAARDTKTTAWSEWAAHIHISSVSSPSSLTPLPFAKRHHMPEYDTVLLSSTLKSFLFHVPPFLFLVSEAEAVGICWRGYGERTCGADMI
jgi:hypothetical protein